jgi:hypothetical protein
LSRTGDAPPAGFRLPLDDADLWVTGVRDVAVDAASRVRADAAPIEGRVELDLLSRQVFVMAA